MTRTLLIGWDGATFPVLDALAAEGVMPFLAGLMGRGTRAELLSTEPPVTFPGWTSLVTGCTPARHGIFDFVLAREMGNGVFVRVPDSRDVHAETIWEMASRQDRTLISLNFPLTSPPRPIQGALIPGFVSWRHLGRAVHPRGLYERVRSLPGLDPQVISWDMDKEQKAVQALPTDQYQDWIRGHIDRERQWFQILLHLMQEQPWDLAGFLADGPDKLQHLAWRLLDPALVPDRPTAWEAGIRGLCLQYFNELDAALERIVTLAGDDTRVFLVSDHGFGPTWEIFYPNVLLHQHGFLEWGPGAEADDSERMFSQRRRGDMYDWERTTAYALTPSSNAVRIRVAKGPGDSGVLPEDYAAVRDRVSDCLLSFTDPASGEPVVRSVTPRERLFGGRLLRWAPDLTLVLRDQGFVSVLKSDTPLRRRNEVKGTHRPEGVFVAAGPGIRQGHVSAPLSIVDVCPALAYSLGVRIPERLDGALPTDVFEPALLQAQPPRYGGAASPEAADDEPLSEDEEAAILSRLTALGYVE